MGTLALQPPRLFHTYGALLSLHLSLYIVDAIMNTLSQYVLVCDRHVTCTKCTLQEGKHS